MKTMGSIMVDGQKSPPGAVGTTRGGWKVVSGCPPTEGSMASLKHKGTGKEGAAPSSRMRGTGSVHLDLKGSGKSKKSLKRGVAMS